MSSPLSKVFLIISREIQPPGWSSSWEGQASGKPNSQCRSWWGPLVVTPVKNGFLLMDVCCYSSEGGWACGEVVNGTLKQVRALRIIRITAQGKIWRFGTKTWDRYSIFKLYRSPVKTLQERLDIVNDAHTDVRHSLWRIYGKTPSTLWQKV